MTNYRSLFLLAACAAMLTAAPAAYAQSSVTLPGTIIASDLDNPRGLAFSPNGSLYIVEAGRGGDGPCIPDPAVQNGIRCYGATGAITQIDLKHGSNPQRLVTGLPSLSEGGTDAIGPHHISFQGNKAYVTVGWGGNPANRATQLGALGTVFGHTIAVTPNGKWSLDVDVAAFEAAANPDGRAPDSDPFGIVARSGRQIVADAGANAVFGIAANGTVTTLATFPVVNVVPPPIPGLPNPFPMEAVPTAVDIGPDGDLYVGQLTGFPFPPGGANVYRVHDGTVSIYASGFTNIVDIAFDDSGALYVLEIAKNSLLSGDPTGGLFRVAPNGGAVTEIQVVNPATQENLLVAPGGIAIGKDGALYITINSTQPFTGGVLRVEP